MRPPRLKLRTLIVLVALATLAVGGVEYRRRAARYWTMAAREEAEEANARDGAIATRQFVEKDADKEDIASLQKLVADYEQEASHHARRRAAYLRCARYPWLSPPADPPIPE